MKSITKPGRRTGGFVPMTDAEISYMAERLKPILMEGLVWITESPTEPAGFILALPDFNEAIQPLKGRLLTPRLDRLPALPAGTKETQTDSIDCPLSQEEIPRTRHRIGDVCPNFPGAPEGRLQGVRGLLDSGRQYRGATSGSSCLGANSTKPTAFTSGICESTGNR